jgi:hypothetical protein
VARQRAGDRGPRPTHATQGHDRHRWLRAARCWFPLPRSQSPLLSDNPRGRRATTISILAGRAISHRERWRPRQRDVEGIHEAIKGFEGYLGSHILRRLDQPLQLAVITFETVVAVLTLAMLELAAPAVRQTTAGCPDRLSSRNVENGGMMSSRPTGRGTCFAAREVPWVPAKPAKGASRNSRPLRQS